MSRPQQNALLQEALDQSWLWRTWSAFKHGLPAPAPPRNVIQDEPPVETPAVIPFVEKTAVASATRSGAIESPSPAGNTARGKLLRNAAIVLASLGAGAGGLAALQPLLAPSPASVSPSPQSQSPVSPRSDAGASNTVQIDAVDGALIPWLRDNGYNLPPTEQVQ